MFLVFPKTWNISEVENEFFKVCATALFFLFVCEEIESSTRHNYKLTTTNSIQSLPVITRLETKQLRTEL